MRDSLREPDYKPGDWAAMSLANVMKLRGPIVIMDEAHDARTKISFDSLARFGPLAVLELTATPQQDHDPDREKYASNVLHAVSALQLKREGMIKLPVELESRDNWMDVLALTVAKRTALAERAATWGREQSRLIRPMALVQAQLKGPHIANDPKELHKEDIGKLWAARSGEKCVFVRVVDKDWAKLEATLNSIVHDG